MRKFGFLAVLAAVLTVSTVMPVRSADKAAYSMSSPTYRGASQQELRLSAIDLQKMKTEARSRKLNYALVGLVGLFGSIAVFSFISARRRKIVSGADAAFIGTLATLVSAKRSLSSKIEARIASKAKSSADG